MRHNARFHLIGDASKLRQREYPARVERSDAETADFPRGDRDGDFGAPFDHLQGKGLL